MLDELKTEVCIVGSGFCGFAAFTALREKGIKALVVEGGEIETPKNAGEQANYALPLASDHCSIVHGKQIRANLDLSFRDRKFTLGGSSECWSGWIKPLERSTYGNAYSTSPHADWDGLTLSPYDETCLKLLKSPILDFDPYNLARSLGFKLPSLPEGLSYTTYAWAETPLRLKQHWMDMLALDPQQASTHGKAVLTGYTLISFEQSKAGEIVSLLFQGRGDRQLKVRAHSFIIAMGGVENAKFANAFHQINPGVNSTVHQRIGHFQEHPHLYDLLRCQEGAEGIPPILARRVPVKANAREFIHNGFVTVSIAAWNGKGTPKMALMLDPVSTVSRREGFKNLLRPLLGRPLVAAEWSVSGRCEQRPMDQSKLNFHGDQAASLDWRVDPADFELYSEYLRRYASFMVSNGYVQSVRLKEPSLAALAIPSKVKGGAHHMGTVAFSPLGQGLVDQDCRLVGSENLYVVGSSTFPTSGFENPTHAAMATALKAVEAIQSRPG